MHAGCKGHLSSMANPCPDSVIPPGNTSYNKEM